MIISLRTFSRKRVTFLVATILFLLALPLISIADSQPNKGSCQVQAGQQYTCPNCGGMQVDDCLGACDGFAFGDAVHNICIRRVLFRAYNVNEQDYSNHYHFLWNDLLGMIAWCFTAAIAISAGVGGGGIYVPLGILLFQFAYVNLVHFRVGDVIASIHASWHLLTQNANTPSSSPSLDPNKHLV
jgi:hypothetical protein